MPVITVPAPLRRQLGDEATDSLVEFVNAAGASTRDDVIEIVGERFERRLSEEMAKVNQRITTEIGGLRVELSERITSEAAAINERITNEIGGLRVELSERITNEVNELRVELARTRSDLIRWMFAFWVGQTVVIATLFTLLR